MTLWAPLKVAEGLFYRSRSRFYQNHKKASLPVLVSTESYFPEHFYSLKEQIIGAVVEECKDGYVVLRKGAVLPQVPPQNKATLLGCQ